MSSAIDTSNILSAISKLEGDLAKLKISLGVPDVAVPKSRKSAPKADGEKKAPNVWIVFTQKVDAALKAAAISTGAAPVAKQFASALKDLKPYAEWTDESIVEAWATWEKPEQSKMGAEKQRKDSASDGTASDSGSKKERKKRAPMSEEAKAAMKAKRAATKAAKAGGGGPELPASAPESQDEEESQEEASAAPPPVPAPAPSKPAPPKAFAKKVASAPKEPVYTREQLADFDSVKIEGAEYGCNVRGDVVDGDGNFVGHWDPKTTVFRRSSTPPADWESVMSSA